VAQAWPFSGLCEEDDKGGPGLTRTQAYPGVAQFLAGVTPASGRGVIGRDESRLNPLAPYRDQVAQMGAITPYEWYGTAGLHWTVGNYSGMDSGCMVGILRSTSQYMGNLAWSVTTFLGATGLTLYAAATSVDFFTPMLSFVDQMLTGNPDIPGDEGLFGSLYLTYLVPVLVLGAAGMVWRGVMRRRASETLQSTLWMLGATTGAILFLTNPGAIAQASNAAVVSVQNGIVTSITAAATGNADVGFATEDGTAAQGESGIAAESTPGVGGMCVLPEGSPDGQRRTLICQQWYAFLYTPWMIGQFGDAAADTTVTLGGAPAVEIPGHEPRYGLALTHLDATAVNHDAVLDRLGGNNTFTDRSQDQWTGVIETVRASGDPAIWAGADWMHRLTTTFLAFLAMVFGSGPIIWFSLLLLLYQLGTIVLILLAPIFLLAGAHPGAGRRVSLGWLEMILSLQIKRIVTVAVLSILLALITLVQRSTQMWLLQVLMIGLLSVMVMLMRDKIIDKFAGVRFGGDQTILQEGNEAVRSVGRTATGAAQIAAGQGAGAGLASAAGLVAGGGAAATAVAMGRRASARKKGKSEVGESQEPGTTGGNSTPTPRAQAPRGGTTDQTTPVTPGPTSEPASHRDPIVRRIYDDRQAAARDLQAATDSAETHLRETQEELDAERTRAQTLSTQVRANASHVHEVREQLHAVLADPQASASQVTQAQERVRHAIETHNSSKQEYAQAQQSVAETEVSLSTIAGLERERISEAEARYNTASDLYQQVTGPRGSEIIAQIRAEQRQGEPSEPAGT